MVSMVGEEIEDEEGHVEREAVVGEEVVEGIERGNSCNGRERP